MSQDNIKKIILPVLAAIIVNNQNQVLIARRKQQLRNGGKWEFPGGKLQHNESPEECLKREIKEEMGVDISVVRPFHLVNYPSKQDLSILLIGYICKLEGGDFHLKDHSEACWVNITNLSSFNLSEPDIPIADHLKKAS